MTPEREPALVDAGEPDVTYAPASIMDASPYVGRIVVLGPNDPRSEPATPPFFLYIEHLRKGPLLQLGTGSLLRPGDGGPSSDRDGGVAVSQSQIDGVVLSHKIGLKRTCLQRVGLAAWSAHVTLHIEWTATGWVSIVQARGLLPILPTASRAKYSAGAFRPGPVRRTLRSSEPRRQA